MITTTTTTTTTVIQEKNQQVQQHDDNDDENTTTTTTTNTTTTTLSYNIVKLVISILIKLIWYKCILLIILFGLFRLIASPPLHLFMNVHTIEFNIEHHHHHHHLDEHNHHNTTTISTPTTNPKESIYVKGAGFSGFWFHYGYLKSILKENDNDIIEEEEQQHLSQNNNQKYDYYCYSSGCLSVVMSLLTEMTVNVGIHKVSKVQQMWFDEKIHQYEMIHYLIETLLDPLYLRDDIDDLLQNVNILITTIDNNSSNSLLTVNKPTSIEELRILLKRTCWIPYFTANDWYVEDHLHPKTYHLDGAFTQTLHPKCSYELNVPTTFTMYYNILNPSITNKNKLNFFNQGLEYGIEFNNRQQQQQERNNTRNTNTNNMNNNNNNNNNTVVNTCSSNNNTQNNNKDNDDKNTLSSLCNTKSEDIVS